MTNPNKPSKEESAVREVEKSPGRDDVHEQRQTEQDKEGAVEPVAPRAPKTAPPTTRQ